MLFMTVPRARGRVVKEQPVVTEFVKGVVKTFKKITDIDEKISFIRNIISSIGVRWDEEQLNHWISVQFRIHKLQDYLLSNELLINRTGATNHKRITKIVSKKIVSCEKLKCAEGLVSSSFALLLQAKRVTKKTRLLAIRKSIYIQR